MKKNFPEGVCLVRGTPEVESRSPEAEDLQAELTDPGRVLGSPRAAPICRNKDLGSHHYPDPGSVSWARVTIRGKQPSAGPAPCIISTKAGLDALGQGPAFPGFWPEHIFKEGGEFLAQMRLKGFWGGRVRTAFQITILPEILSPRLNYKLQSTVN